MDNYDVVLHTEEARERIAYCPADNVLFDELTVEEHLIFFAMVSCWAPRIACFAEHVDAKQGRCLEHACPPRRRTRDVEVSISKVGVRGWQWAVQIKVAASATVKDAC